MRYKYIPRVRKQQHTRVQSEIDWISDCIEEFNSGGYHTVQCLYGYKGIKVVTCLL
jgi:hypothetical protein